MCLAIYNTLEFSCFHELFPCNVGWIPSVPGVVLYLKHAKYGDYVIYLQYCIVHTVDILDRRKTECKKATLSNITFIMYS
jgi:hypothetical protein